MALSEDDMKSITSSNKMLKGSTEKPFVSQLREVIDPNIQISSNRQGSNKEEIQYKEFKKKHILDLHSLPLCFEKFSVISLAFNFHSLLYTLFTNPIRFAIGIIKYVGCCFGKIDRRRRLDMYCFCILVIVELILIVTIDTSSIYHWIKGKSFLKLYTFYVMTQVSDLLIKSAESDLIYSLARCIYHDENCFKVAIIFGISVLIHSYLLILQLLGLNSVIKSSKDSFFLFMFSINFVKIKITVFKKIDEKILFEYASRDSNERLLQAIFYAYILINNTVDGDVISCIIWMFVMEYFFVWVKHFFLIKFYSFSPGVYLSYRYILCKIFIDCVANRSKREKEKIPENSIKKDDDIVKDLQSDVKDDANADYVKKENNVFLQQCNQVLGVIVKPFSDELLLYRNILNEYYGISIFQTFMIFPQACIVLRCVYDIIINKEFTFGEATIFIILLILIGRIIEFFVCRFLRFYADRLINIKHCI